jgi:DNA modification methylase
MPKLPRKIQKPTKAVRKSRVELAVRRPGPLDPAPKTTVDIAAAKGRPMLTWVGKRPLGRLPAFPAQLIEKFHASSLSPQPSALSGEAACTDWPSKYPKGGLLFHGDNKEVLAHLLANGFRGKVQLIYIDPPFDSGADYVRKVSLRGPVGSTKIDGDHYSLGEQIQYSDIWANDNYLQFMFERLLILKELLAANGAMYLHCDYRRNYFLRALLDETFGPGNVTAEIIWKRTSARSDSHGVNMIHDTIFQVTKGAAVWNRLLVPHSAEYMDRFSMTDPVTGKKFQGTDLTARGLRAGETGRPWHGFDPAAKGNHWLKRTSELDELDRQGKIYWPPAGGWPRLKYFEDEAEGLPLQSIWADVFVVNSQAEERTDYPTQKPELLLDRIIRSSSEEGGIVLDCFLGSGTTSVAAQRLGRRWIGCDINKGAIQTTAKRIQALMREQSVENAAPTQSSLIGEDDAQAKPAQLGYSVWRVNDYDLQIQHNEAVNLACEHLGVQRTKADNYFDGTLGKSLVKIVPFDHPLSPLDVEELKRELDARKEEDRMVTFVCLGMEIAAKPIIDDWNRLRKGKNAANRIEVIELRRDAKHGGWLNHMPAQAEVSIARKAGSVVIQIENFISPSIVERLQQQAGILEPKIDDCRAMIDSVAIDTNYDGRVFNVALIDVPERKSDYVEGCYELPAAAKGATVAVRITDMLGEEVLITKIV